MCDVFIKIVQLGSDNSTIDLEELAASTRNLINLQHTNLLTPLHSFNAKNDIWIVYPRSSGGPLSELLKSHYPNGIPNESMVACLLRDAAHGLHNLHQHQIVHRNIRASSLHIDRDEGVALLTEFGVLKEIKFKHAKNRNNTLVPTNRHPWTHPLILAEDESVSWFNGDVYAFGVTALEITFGEVPPSKILPQQAIMHDFVYAPATVDSYDKPCPFGKQFQSLIKDCCTVTDRVSINQLIKHPFFKKACPPSMIKKEICHLIQSIESRVNPAFLAPTCFTNAPRVDDTPVQSNDAIDSITFDFNTDILSVRHSDNAFTNNNNTNTNTNNTHTNTKNTGLQATTIVEETSDVIPMINDSNNNPTGVDVDIQHQSTQIQVLVEHINGNNASRIRRVSFSDSHSADLQAEETPTEKVPDKKGRFNIEVLNNNAGDEEADGTVNHYGRFDVTSGKQTPQAVHIAEQIDFANARNNSNNNNNSHNQNQSSTNEAQVQTSAAVNRNQQAIQQASQVQPPPAQTSALPKDVLNWTEQHCADWLATLGDAYVKYQEAFISNGIEGQLIQEFDDEMLLEIVPNKLHRRKIIISAKKLFPEEDTSV
jgi:serine/threonine-protein kinase OSR1/STK39